MNHEINPNRILIVDDEKDVAELLRSAARSLGFLVRTTGDFDSFCDIQPEFDPTVLLLDMEMPGKSANEYLKVLARQESPARVILTSGIDRRATSRAEMIGAVLGLDMATTLQKPLAIHTVRQALRKLLLESRPVTAPQLSLAIKRGEIRPHFQPKVCRDKNGAWSVREAEALARWYQPDGSIVMPDNFIGLAEDNGLIRALTLSLVKQVALQLGRWACKGIFMRVAVNLSPSLLTDRDLPNQLEAQLQEYDIGNEQLILEMTEQALTGYTPVVIDVLQRLSKKKFGLSIDNFGTGSSSPELLYRMPFDEIKIDRSFMQRCSTKQEYWSLVEAIVFLGQKLGKSVCAEGVETHAAFNQLSRIGCDKQQGFLVGKPVPGINLKFLHQLSPGKAVPAVAPIS
jgi:EAL domain-containing protein (putative c-di-GMP-specific phosphodiesterase class I)/CheY-like chemotaxis protein